MRAVVQRASRASVAVDGETIAEMGKGLVALVGVGEDDGPDDVDYLAQKIVGLRVFDDDEGKMNLSAPDVDAGIMLVPQFTLYGDCRRGRRPSFDASAPPDVAETLYEQLVESVRARDVRVETGEFKSFMELELVNDGPVTLLLDSKKNF